MNTEQIVAKVNELSEGQMKKVRVGDRDVLLVCLEGKYHAYLAECPHQGAPLAEGLLADGHIRCPWHQAVFDALNGDLLEPPSLDRLRNYDVRIEGDDVIVVLPSDPAAEGRAQAVGGRDDSRDSRTFAVLGSGAAGMAAVERLRQEGFAGRIVLLTAEEDVGYDRTELSKTFLTGPDTAEPIVRDREFYQALDVEVLAGEAVEEVDVARRTLRRESGDALEYDRLLVATGGSPRRLECDGEDLPGVHVLRSLRDARRIRADADSAESVVIVGAGFVGMEAASALRKRGLDVTVVAPETAPFEGIFGERIGERIRREHREKGVEFRLGNGVERFEGGDRLERVVLTSGERIDAGLALVGLGIRPRTDFLRGADLNADGSVTVDWQMRFCDGHYAAGDVARLPDWRSGSPIRIEHWRVAMQHGRAAATGMLDRDERYRGVPFFWTEQHGLIVQYVGHADGWEEAVFDGDPDDGAFVAYYLKQGRVLAAAGVMEDLKMARIAERLARPEAPQLEQMRELVAAV
jgi:NADPH-dependent 2,4-dienoyl-CoA reductase/sulfur reductase-like enzyme/nitrite reductase/ring-hydroxylating ferredoxin subunit